MRKITLILLSLGALLSFSLYWQGPANAQDPQRLEPLSPTEVPEGDACWGWGGWFGKRIAGTYLMWAEWDPVTEPVFPILLTIDADGTMLSTS